ncbi:hypothetical protein M9H77_22044 [Catharanthus roseus]|uniref:Uncharacterized protein n=1 Tax=Catharanthus roseus TaxID=4058 RepID=A0ACC0AQ24_CATRO|nr:hypothetical protein M9H77_22044 [Catharanthus roseus]
MDTSHGELYLLETTYDANTNEARLESVGEEFNRYREIVIHAIRPSFTTTEDINEEEELDIIFMNELRLYSPNITLIKKSHEVEAKFAEWLKKNVGIMPETKDAGARPTSLSNGAEENNSQGRAVENSFETSYMPQVMTALDVSRGAIGTPNLPSHDSQPFHIQPAGDINKVPNEGHEFAAQVASPPADQWMPSDGLTHLCTGKWTLKSLPTGLHGSLSDTELLEINPHLILEGLHRGSGGYILTGEVIGLIVLTLLIIRLRRGLFYYSLSGFLNRTKIGMVTPPQPVVLGQRDPNFLLFIPGYPRLLNVVNMMI